MVHGITHIYHQNWPNVGEYTIHESYGIGLLHKTRLIKPGTIGGVVLSFWQIELVAFGKCISGGWSVFTPGAWGIAQVQTSEIHTNTYMKEAFAICFEIPGWCPQRKRGTLSSEEKHYFILFYFMKSVVGFLTLLNRNCRMVKRGSLKCISVHFTKINNILSSLLERLPNLTTKQKSTQWAHHCERNVITKSWSLGLPTQHQQDRQVSIPQRLAEKSLPFPAPPVDLLRAQRIGFYLGFQDFSLSHHFGHWFLPSLAPQ